MGEQGLFLGAKPNGKAPSLSFQLQRDQLFKSFHKQTGLKPFGPDFHDALVAVMRDPNSCMSERAWAWTRWKTFCNHSFEAVSHWNPELAYSLDQRDCALDLWWFEQGKTVEWVEAASREYREREKQRPEVLKLRCPVNRAFGKLQVRGNVDIKGHRIYAIASPSGSSAPKISATRDFSQDKEFLEWAKISATRDLSDYQEAVKSYFEARKILRTRYREYLAAEISRNANLITEITTSNTDNLTTTGAEPSAPIVLPIPVVQPLVEAFKAKGATIDPCYAAKLVEDCRQSVPDVTAEELAILAIQVAIHRNGKGLTNLTGFLIKMVRNSCDTDTIAQLRERLRRQQAGFVYGRSDQCGESPPDSVSSIRRCNKCGGQIVNYQSGEISWCKCGPLKEAQ